MIIYETTNLVNGKKYIGQDTKNNPDYLGSGRLIRRAIKKYGKENFKKVILECCETIEELNEREKYWTDKVNAVNNPIYYNLREGGRNAKLSEEIIKKIVETKKERYATKEIVPWNKGVPRTEETKQKISKTKKYRYASGEIIPWNGGWKVKV